MHFYPPLFLSVSLNPLFLAHPWMHAGSRDLLLYQHRARCTLGASCLPFISTGYTDVSVGLCAARWIHTGVFVCVHVCQTRRQIVFFLGARLSERRLRVGACINVDMRICVYLCPGKVWMCVRERAEGSYPKPLPGDSGGL